MQKCFLFFFLILVVPVSLAETDEGRAAKVKLEYQTKPQLGGELVRLANSADSREERDSYIRELIALDLDPLYLRHFAVLLRMDVNTMLRIGLSIPQEEVLEEKPEEEREGQVSSTSTAILIDRFVMIVHGLNSGPGTIENPNWPLKMGLAYAHVLDDSLEMSDFEREAIGYSLKFDDVEIVVVDWSVIARFVPRNKNPLAKIFSIAFANWPDEIFVKASNQGNLWGDIYAKKWSKDGLIEPTKVHLIGHSNGCIFADSFSRKISSPGRNIQLTLLDAYVPDEESHESEQIGNVAHFTEHFLHRGRGISVADIVLPYAYNVDVTNLLGLWSDSNFAKDHGFPYRWYIELLEKGENFRPGPMNTVIFGNMPRHSSKKFTRGDVYVVK